MLYLIVVLCYFFCQSQAILLSSHFFVNQGHVVLGALLLVFLCHAEHFSVALPYVLHEVSTVANECALNRVDQRTSALVEAVTAANLQQL